MLRSSLIVVTSVLLLGGEAPTRAIAPDGDSGESRTARTTRSSVESEIIVSARRRNEPAMSVPLALTAVDSEQLAVTGTDGLDRLQRLDPSLSIFGYNARTTSIGIRGLGGTVGLTSDGLEAGVGVFLDNVYVGRVGAALFELVDLERAEILRGPQNVLLGRSTTAGAVHLLSRPPQLDAADRTVSLSVGDHGYRRLGASLSSPLLDGRMAGRLSISGTRRDGFMRNVGSGEDVHDSRDLTARGQLLLQVNDALSLRGIVDYAAQDRRCCTVVGIGVFERLDSGEALPNPFRDRAARLGYTPLPFDPFARRVDANSPFRADMEQRGVSLHADWVQDGLEIQSVTAWRSWDWNPRNDGDDTALPAVTALQQLNRQKQFSQEVRITSRGERRFDYVAGLYHYRETLRGTGLLAYGPAAPQWYFPSNSPLAEAAVPALDDFATRTESTAKTRSTAAFGELTWHVTDAFELTAGTRFTDERRDGRYLRWHSAGADLSEVSSGLAETARQLRSQFGLETYYTATTQGEDLSSTVTLSHTSRTGRLTYLTAARASKPGGLNLGNFPPNIDPEVLPERVRHYEIGTKATLLDDSLTFDAALYQTAVHDYQTSVVQSPSDGGQLIEYIDNIDRAESRGLELRGTWTHGRRFSLSASVAHIDARYVAYPNGPCPIERSLRTQGCNLSGNPLAGVPKRAWTLSLQGEELLRGALGLYWRVDYSRQSDLFTAVGNSRYSVVDGYDLVNIRLGFTPGNGWWDLSLWSRNAFDEEYFQLTTGRSTGWIVGLPGDPRTIGVTVSARLR